MVSTERNEWGGVNEEVVRGMRSRPTLRTEKLRSVFVGREEEEGKAEEEETGEKGREGWRNRE